MFALPPQSVAPPPPPKGQARLLILDDERFDRHRLQRLCSTLPQAIELATADCLAALAQHLEGAQFDLIFVDHNLPDGNGMDALEMIRLCPRNCTAATVMITGRARGVLEQEAADQGCAAFLSKDELTGDLFAQTVAHALRHRSASPPPEAPYERAAVETLLARARVDFARDMKPLVSRMLRQLRLARGGFDATGIAPQSGIQGQSVEDSCIALWDYLIALEQQDASLPSWFEETGRAAQDAMEGEHGRPKRKAPSPFSRMN